MLVDLRQHDVGQDLARPVAVAFDHRRGGLVACRLDSEYKHCEHVAIDCRPAYHCEVRCRNPKCHPVPARGCRDPADRHARQPAGAGAGRHGARRAGQGAWLRSGADRAPGDPHHRRPHPGPAAGGGRRQGPVRQGDRGGAARRPHRPGGAFVQGHADRFCRTAWCSTAFLPREDARDAFVSRKARTLAELPRGAVVGTSSPRRQALVRRMRPDLRGRRSARQCRNAAAQARRRRGRRDAAGARRAQAARPRRCRGDGVRARRIPAGGRAGRDRHRDARGRRQDARAARRRSTMPTPRPRSRASAPSSPRSTARAARRSPAMPPSPAAA